MDVIPAIDLMAGKCVRLIQGQYHRQITYEDNPVKQAQEFIRAGPRATIREGERVVPRVLLVAAIDPQQLPPAFHWSYQSIYSTNTQCRHLHL